MKKEKTKVESLRIIVFGNSVGGYFYRVEGDGQMLLEIGHFSVAAMAFYHAGAWTAEHIDLIHAPSVELVVLSESGDK